MIALYGELRRKRLAVDAKKKELQAAKVTGAELKHQFQDYETSLNAANSAGKGRGLICRWTRHFGRSRSVRSAIDLVLEQGAWGKACDDQRFGSSSC